MNLISKLSLSTLMVFMLPSIAAAVDESSRSYKVGSYVGYAVIFVLLFLIIKKILGK